MSRVNSFDYIYKDEKFKNCIKKNFPYIIDVELTNNCNLLCSFCSRNIMRRGRGFLSNGTFKKILKECINFNTPIRFIRWGEPFLHSNVMSYSKMIIDSGLPVHITTNGLLVDEKMSEEMVYMGLDSIIFSMQGVENTYKNMRGDNYNLVKNNILKLIEIRDNEEKPYIKITSTMTNETKEQIDKFIGCWSGLVDDITIGRTDMSRINGELPKNAKYIPCTEVYQKLSVDWNGGISACCADYDRLLALGNIDESSLYYIWNNSKKLKQIRKILGNMEHRKLKLCKNCYPAYD
jgi:radical SAM protein with 4Fe4S-binding SPASM domain